MCYCYAISSNKRINANIAIDGRSLIGYSGHGVCEYQDTTAYCQRALPSEDEPRQYSMQSKLILAHVRVASIGEDSLVNCHPFHRIIDEKEYIGMAQGTLPYFYKLDSKYRPYGSTDVERAFLHALAQIQKQNISDDWSTENFRWLSGLLQRLNSGGGFNAVMSNGKYLFAYADKDASGLYSAEIAAPFDDITLQDDFCKINMAGESNPSQVSVISSNPLSNHKWIRFDCGELRVYYDGACVFSSSKSSLEQLLKKIKYHDCGVICPYRSEYSNKENQQRARSLELKLIGLGYRTYIVKGALIEHMGTPDSHEVSTNMYFVSDWKHRGKLDADLLLLGKAFGTDSVLFIPEGGKTSVLMGTNGNTHMKSHCEGGSKLPILENKNGTPIMLLRVEGSPFVFQDDGIMGEFWAGGYITRGYAGIEGRKDWRVLNLDNEKEV